MKKGVSPLIAAVILIAFVIAVAGVASGFFTGFFKKRQSEISEKGETVVECGVANLQIQENILSCSAPNWDSMEARWHFDEGSGLTAYDSSQNSNDGTLIDDNATNDDGDDPPHWVNGKFGKALDFDGQDDYVDVGDTSDYSIKGEITVSAWVKYNEQDWNGLVSAGGAGKAFTLYYDNGRFLIENEGGTYQMTNPPTIPTGKWYHVVGTYDKSLNSDNIKSYHNGDLVDTADQSGDINTGFDVFVGTVTPSNKALNGTLDSVRIYDRALSQNQIEYLYSHGTQLRFSILNKGQTSLGKNFGVTVIINGTSVSGSVSLDNSLDKAEIQTVTALENITAAGQLDKVRIASKACGNVKDVARPEDVYC